MNSLKDKNTGQVYTLDNSYNIGLNALGDVSFNGNLFIGNNLTVVGDISSQYLTTKINKALVPISAVSYNNNYIVNGNFSNPQIDQNDWCLYNPFDFPAKLKWTTSTESGVVLLNNMPDYLY